MPDMQIYDQHPVDVSYCESCSLSDNLYMCIVCGYIGCSHGQPDSGDIKAHYDSTSHTYAMNMESKSGLRLCQEGICTAVAA